MSKTQAWTANGAGLDAREVARETARQQGKSLGEWLHGAIAGESEAAAPKGQIGDQDRIDAVTARLEQLGARAGDNARRSGRTRFDPRARVRRSPDDRYLGDEELEEDVHALREQGLGRNRFPRDQTRADGLDANDDMVENAIAALELRASRTERRTGQALASMAKLLEETQSRRDREYNDVAALTLKLGHLEANLVDRYSAASETPIRSSLARLEARLDAIGRRGIAEAAVRQNAMGMQSYAGEPIGRLEEKVNSILEAVQPQEVLHASSAAVAAAQANPGSGRRSLGEAIAEISRRQRALEQPAAANGEGPAPSSSRRAHRGESEADLASILRTEMANLASRVDDIRRDTLVALREQSSSEGELAALRSDVGALTRTLDGWTSRESIEALGGSITILSERLEGFRGQGMHEAALAPVEAALAELRLSLQAADPREAIVGLGGELHLIGEKLDGLAATDRSGIDRLQQQMEEMRASVGTLASRTTSLDRIEHRIVMLAERLDGLNAPRKEGSLSVLTDVENGHLEHLVRELDSKFEAARKLDGERGALDALQRQIEHLSDRLERSEAGLSTLPSLAASLRDLFKHLESPRSNGEVAAGDVETGAGTTADGEPRRSASMRARQDDIEARTSAALNTVHDVLGKVVERLASIENDVRDAKNKPHGETVTSPTERQEAHKPIKLPSALSLEGDARDEIRLGGMEPRVDAGAATTARKVEAPSAKTLKSNAPVDGRRGDFIAAARRAAAAAQAEATSVRRLTPHDKVARPSLISRSKDYVATHRRPALMGMAAIVMAFGVLALVSRLSGGSSPDPEVASLPAETKTAVVASVEAPVPTPAPNPTPALPPKAAVPVVAETDPTATASIPSLPSFAAGPALQPRPVLPKGLAAAAEGGNPAAEYELATRFVDGRSVPRDMKTAANWFEKAAAAGVVPAQYRLAALYEKGVGVTADRARAKALYVKAAEAGNPRAMHNLAVMLADGDGKPDYNGAIAWFRKAAEYGVHDSQYNLAVLLGRGLGTTQDLVQSYQWFAVAAAANDADAEKKRGEVEAKLPAGDLAAAKALAASFKPKTPDASAMEVSPPPGGWDGAPGASRLNSPRSKISSL